MAAGRFNGRAGPRLRLDDPEPAAFRAGPRTPLSLSERELPRALAPVAETAGGKGTTSALPRGHERMFAYGDGGEGPAAAVRPLVQVLSRK